MCEHGVLLCWACCDSIPQEWAAEATEMYCCTVWRQGVSNQGVGGGGFFEGYREELVQTPLLG